eukprot:gene17352-19775_t
MELLRHTGYLEFIFVELTQNPVSMGHWRQTLGMPFSFKDWTAKLYLALTHASPMLHVTLLAFQRLPLEP